MLHPTIGRLLRGAVLLGLPLILGLAPAPVAAWGKLGHRVVGELVEAGLSPAARSGAEALLRDEGLPGLAEASIWPDRVRDLPEWRHTAPWHYLNFPRDGGCDYDAARDCPGGDCVVGAIERQLAVLADTGRPRSERAEALKFVVHFVADVHQPLHAGFGHDKGGNDHQISLRLPGHDPEGTNLHAVWDRWLLTTRSGDVREHARVLGGNGLILSERDAVHAGLAARWAEESCRIVREPGFYSESRRMDARYLDHWRPTADKRLRQAAGRLVVLLEDALG